MSVADDYWNFSNSDSEKVELLGGLKGEDEIFTKEGALKDEDRLIEAQDMCPTGSIEVEVVEGLGEA